MPSRINLAGNERNIVNIMAAYGEFKYGLTPSRKRAPVMGTWEEIHSHCPKLASVCICDCVWTDLGQATAPARGSAWYP